jgi:hypothetical protein
MTSNSSEHLALGSEHLKPSSEHLDYEQITFNTIPIYIVIRHYLNNAV